MIQTATLAKRCLWCKQARFTQLKSVKKVITGYCRGTSKNPTYKQVCTGQTNHTESMQIQCDGTKSTFNTILNIFFATHDPTTRNQQDTDKGTQYRSTILYHTQVQEQIAKQKSTELTERKKIKSPIVTEITSNKIFILLKAITKILMTIIKITHIAHKSSHQKYKN